MSAITFTIDFSEELAERLEARRERLAEVVELGLREVDAAAQGGFAGAREVLEALAALPGPEEVLRMRPSAGLQERVRELEERSREGGLDAREQEEWARYEFLEHLVRMAKARAVLKLSSAGGV